MNSAYGSIHDFSTAEEIDGYLYKIFNDFEEDEFDIGAVYEEDAEMLWDDHEYARDVERDYAERTWCEEVEGYLADDYSDQVSLLTPPEVDVQREYNLDRKTRGEYRRAQTAKRGYRDHGDRRDEYAPRYNRQRRVLEAHKSRDPERHEASADNCNWIIWMSTKVRTGAFTSPLPWGEEMHPFEDLHDNSAHRTIRVRRAKCSTASQRRDKCREEADWAELDDNDAELNEELQCLSDSLRDELSSMRWVLGGCMDRIEELADRAPRYVRLQILVQDLDQDICHELDRDFP